MKTPLALFLFSVAAILAAVAVPELNDLILIAAPCAIASLILLFWVRIGARAKKLGPALILDGSNVMYWRDNEPDIGTVTEVVAYLSGNGYRLGVMFDANAGYILAGRYQHDGALARSLRLPANRVMVVPKGTPADPMILQAARDMDARIVTNDKFRDWAAEFPEVTKPDFLIPGGFRDGKLWLELEITKAET